MKRSDLVALGLLAGTVLMMTPTAAQRTAPSSGQMDIISGRPAVAGEVLVKFRRTLTTTERAALEQFIDADQDVPLGRTGVRRVHSRRYDTSTLIALSRNYPDVTFAEPNYIVQADAVPNDPFFGELWGLRNIGQIVGTAGTPGADIGATSAWDISTGSRAVAPRSFARRAFDVRRRRRHA